MFTENWFGLRATVMRDQVDVLVHPEGSGLAYTRAEARSTQTYPLPTCLHLREGKAESKGKTVANVSWVDVK